MQGVFCQGDSRDSTGYPRSSCRFRERACERSGVCGIRAPASLSHFCGYLRILPSSSRERACEEIRACTECRRLAPSESAGFQMAFFGRASRTWLWGACARPRRVGAGNRRRADALPILKMSTRLAPCRQQRAQETPPCPEVPGTGGSWASLAIMARVHARDEGPGSNNRRVSGARRGATSGGRGRNPQVRGPRNGCRSR